MVNDVTLRVKLPCADAGEFHARLAGRIAEHGLRLASDERPAIGSPARVALEFKDGGVLRLGGVVEEHVAIDGRPGVRVRLPELDRSPPPGAAAPRGIGELAADRLDGAEDPRSGALAFTGSTEIAAAVARRTRGFQRAALAVAAGAVLVALAGLAATRWAGPSTPASAAAAHVRAADRLLREGRVTGKGGALDHLLAAQRLAPADGATAARLDHVADMLERLAAGALDRGDLAVAAIHLASARAAAPDRPSLRAKQEELDRRARLAAAR